MKFTCESSECTVAHVNDLSVAQMIYLSADNYFLLFFFFFLSSFSIESHDFRFTVAVLGTEFLANFRKGRKQRLVQFAETDCDLFILSE